MTNKLYDQPKMQEIGEATQLPPTSETPRPGLEDCFRDVVDPVGGEISQIKPQVDPNKGEYK